MEAREELVCIALKAGLVDVDMRFSCRLQVKLLFITLCN